MIIDSHSAAVDADFIIQTANIKRSEEHTVEILREILGHLGIKAIIHPLVYKNELDLENAKVQAFFDQAVISPLTFNDIFQGDKEKKKYYCFLIPELYNALTGKSFPDSTDVLTYWSRQKSLGEIHSVVMCLICGCGLFLSDDNDSRILKQIIKQRALGCINIYNRKEILEEYMRNGTGKLLRGDRRAFAHN